MMVPLVTFDRSVSVGNRLSSDPFQRAGAWVLTHLGGADHPDALSDEQFERAWTLVQQWLVDAAFVKDASSSKEGKPAQPFAWWQRTIADHFPQTKMQHPMRHKHNDNDLGKLEEAVRRQLNMENVDGDVPCSVCGDVAVVEADKSTWPLAAPGLYIAGPVSLGAPLALCRWCRACGWAVPLGAVRYKSMSLLFTSPDCEVERTVVGDALWTNREMLVARVGDEQTKRGYEGTETVLSALQGYAGAVDGPVDLLVYKAGNQTQEARIFELDTDVARWVSTCPPAHIKVLADIYAWRKKDGTVVKNGRVAFADALFGRDSSRRRVGSVVKRAVLGSENVERQAALTAAYIHYLEGTGKMNNNEMETVDSVARKVVHYIQSVDYTKHSESFRKASNGGPKDLKDWFKTEMWNWTKVADTPDPLITDTEWRALFPVEGGWDARDLLAVKVVQMMHQKETPEDVPTVDTNVENYE